MITLRSDTHTYFYIDLKKRKFGIRTYQDLRVIDLPFEAYERFLRCPGCNEFHKDEAKMLTAILRITPQPCSETCELLMRKNKKQEFKPLNKHGKELQKRLMQDGKLKPRGNVKLWRAKRQKLDESFGTYKKSTRRKQKEDWSDSPRRGGHNESDQ